MRKVILQPANKAIRVGGTIAGRLEWNSGFANKWNGRYDEAQRFVDNEVLKQSEPYLPFQTGGLRDAGIAGTIPGSGEVVWNGPYARYQYYGKVMVGRAPKDLTDRDLTYHGAPKRGAFWFERMMADRGRQIIAGARKIAGGGA
jgi:hypothetical protein